MVIETLVDIGKLKAAYCMAKYFVYFNHDFRVFLVISSSRLIRSKQKLHSLCLTVYDMPH